MEEKEYSVLGLIQIALVVLKVHGDIPSIDWFVVFLPCTSLFIHFIFEFVFAVGIGAYKELIK